MKNPLHAGFAVVCVSALFVCLPFASAQQAGYDLLKTGTDASIELPSRRRLQPFHLQPFPFRECLSASAPAPVIPSCIVETSILMGLPI